MKIVGEYKYAVIQFLEQPCSSIDDYICIPQSWIRVRRVTDRKSIVAYPSESPSLIENRVKKAEMVSEKWRLYMAIVKHETNSYEDANNYIASRRYNSSTDKRCSRTISAEHELLPVTTPEINSSSRKRIKQSNNHHKRLKVVDDGPSPAMVAGNNSYTLHAAIDPLILANQISQGVHQPQGQQQSSTYQDHLQRIVLNHEIHRRTISNLQSLLPDFLTNQKCSQGSRQSTPYTAQNPTQNSQIPNSSIHKDHSHVQITQEIPVSHSSKVNCTNYIPSSSEMMYIPSTSNSEGQSTFPTQYIDVNQPPVDGSQSHLDPSEHEMIVDGSTVNCNEQSVSFEICKENESSAVPNSQDWSIECSMKRLPPADADKVTKDEGSSTQDNVNEQSSTAMSTEEILTSQIPDNAISNVENLWLDRMAGIFEKMNSDFLNTCKMAHEMHESLVQSAKTFQCIASVSDNLRKLKKSKATVEKPIEVTVGGKKVSEKEQVEKEKEKSDVDMVEKDDNEAKKSDDNKKVAEKKQTEMKKKEKSDVEIAENKDESEPKNGDDNNESGNEEDKNKDKDKNKDGAENKDKDEDHDKDQDEDKDEETPKKIRGCIRAFVLPPEYDPNDTKWTLKYRKPDSKVKKLGLVELVKKSRVYVNAIKLAHCKRVSKDAKTLARMLLVEIFSLKALSVCSLTGARANAFDLNGKNVRPGLDEHARMVLLSSVEEHARLKGWGPFDTQSVINSIRSKIQEIRAKYGQI